MDKQIQTLKKCSASTHVEAATKPLRKAKRGLKNSKTLPKLKKHKKSDVNPQTTLEKEVREIAKSLKELSDSVKILHDNSLSKSDVEEILVKVKETPKEKVEPEYECCFETEDAVGNNRNTIFVLGFSCSRTRDEVKSALKKHFGSCGEITRVFVPIQCKTGSPTGFAFIDLMRNGAEKALTLDGSYLGEMKIKVTMAKDRPEYYQFPKYFKGCRRCSRIMLKRRYESFVSTHGDRLIKWKTIPLDS